MSYRITILDADDNPVASVERSTRGGRPTVGEEIRLDGALYRVERVQHEDDAEDRTLRRYTTPHLFVRAMRERGGRARGAVRVLPLIPAKP